MHEDAGGCSSKGVVAEERIVAEREGFEPSIAVSHYAGLANLCLQPLGHLSG